MGNNNDINNIYDITWFNWYGYDVTNPKKLEKLIKKLERIIRIAPEYKTWADKCRLGYHFCPKCKTSKELLPLEVHHTPETLFDIVENVINKHINNEDLLNLSPIDIVKEVLELHLNNDVSYEILCKACHEKVHNERKISKKVKDYKE